MFELGEMKADLLWDLGENKGLTQEKVLELWDRASRFPVLFSDDISGKFEPFLFTLMNPVSIWWELSKADEGGPNGIAYINNLHPGIDASVHITFWDSRPRPWTHMILIMAEWLMDRFNLMRLGTTIPPYQRGVIRFVERLGFVKEGEMRDATRYKGSPWPLFIFGLTKKDLDQRMRELY